MLSRMAMLGLMALVLSACHGRPQTYREAEGSAACTQDCSGHEAGWRWARAHHVANPDKCGGNGESFIEGCRAYTRDGGAFPATHNSESSIAQTLDDCSPFNSFDGRSQLEFDASKAAVTQSEDLSGANPKGDQRDASTQPVVGAFSADGVSKAVSVNIAGQAMTYRLAEASDGDYCILALGDINSVDLEKSWFGKIEPDPPDDLEQPP